VILFLDLDGVVIPEGRAFRPVRGNISQEAILRLNEVAADINAEIVFISCRRRFVNREYLKQILIDAGYTGEFHKDYCIEPHVLPFNRGKGINDWCDKHHVKPEDYIILDDKDRGLRPHQKHRQIQTDTFDLLTPADVKSVRQLVTSAMQQSQHTERG
jgi:hypothetical protein